MLDFFRNHKILTTLVLVVGIVPGLGFIGVQSFRDIFDESANIVSVNGHKISHTEFDQEVRRQTDVMREAIGSKFNLKEFDTPQHRQDILTGMIRQQLLNDEVRRLYLSASDDAVRRAIMSQTWVAALKNPDGVVDLGIYRQVLARQGFTPEQFDERTRFNLASQQLPDAINASAFAPKSLAERLIGLYGQTRDVQGLGLRAETYVPKVQPTDAQVQAYYDAHRNDFAVPATAQIQYVVLSPQAIAESFQPSQADLEQFYKANIASYSTPEQVRMSHIEIVVPQGASAAERAAARRKADTVLAEVRAHPGQFAQIAQKESQDTGSAASGGDLGYVTPGNILGGNAFNAAISRLKKGEISDVLQSDLGYHIVLLTDVKPVTTQPFDQVRASIIESMKAQQVPALVSSESDGFSTMVHEQPKSLQPVADKYRLTIQTATVTPRPNAALPPDSPLNNAKFLAAVFASDSLDKHNSTEAFDVGNSTLIAAHVTSYKPAAVPAFAQVKDAVRQKVIAQEAAGMARKDGQAMLAALQKSKSTEGFSPVLKVSRTNAQSLPPAAMSAIYKVDPQHLPAYVGVDLGDAGYAIYRVDAVTNGVTDAAQLGALQQQLAQGSALLQSQAYFDALSARAKIKFYGQVSATGNGAGLESQ